MTDESVAADRLVEITGRKYKILPQSDYKVGPRCHTCCWLTGTGGVCMAKDSWYMPMAFCDDAPEREPDAPPTETNSN